MTNITGGASIKICDAIMGSGKTSAAIDFINNNQDRRFIYVAPLVDEDRRIARACPSLNFVLPDDHGRQDTKRNDLKMLLRQHKNAAISHVLLSRCDQECYDLMKAGGYTMIIDEVVDIAEDSKLKSGDIRHLLKYEDCEIRDETIYFGESFQRMDTAVYDEIKRLASSHRLVVMPGEKVFYWMISEDMLRTCQEIYVLTYLFEKTLMWAFMQRHNIPYTKIFVDHPDEGVYRFADHLVYLPPFAAHIPELLDVCRDRKLNAIGDEWNALSSNHQRKARLAANALKDKKRRGELVTVQEKKGDLMHQLRGHIRSFFFYRNNASGDDVLWTTFKESRPYLEYYGYKGGHIPMNAKAMNEFGDRHYLAYCANVFLNPIVVTYFKDHDILISHEDFALTTLLQWIWRSAIRRNEPVHLYLPSARMRQVLDQWMETCGQEYERLHQSNTYQQGGKV